jgi:hypothetical protein
MSGLSNTRTANLFCPSMYHSENGEARLVGACESKELAGSYTKDAEITQLSF